MAESSGVFYYACFWDNTQAISKTENLKMNIVCSKYAQDFLLRRYSEDGKLDHFVFRRSGIERSIFTMWCCMEQQKTVQYISKKKRQCNCFAYSRLVLAVSLSNSLIITGSVALPCFFLGVTIYRHM
jgi:hypothetical protein